MKSNYKLNRKRPKFFWQTLLLMMLLGCCCNIVGQSVTIPANNANQFGYTHPLGSYAGYQHTAMIYTAAELGLVTGSKITAISFYYNSFTTPNGISSYVARMLNTTATTFTPTTFANEIVGTTQVASGATVFPSFLPASGWETITLTTPFIYTGNNLKIIIQNTTADFVGNESSTAKQFRWSNGPSQIWQNNTIALGISNDVSDIRPNIKIDYLIPPANDACSGALQANAFPYTNLQTNAQNATNNSGFLQCANPMNDGVWYRFQGTGSNMQVGIFNLDATFDAQLDVYTGSCGNLSCVASADLGFAGGIEELTIATTQNLTYYINVGNYRSDVDEPEGNFTIQIFNLSPSNIEFNYSSIANIGYENQSITIKVERQGGTNGVCTIDYAPNDGSAYGNIDYGPCVGTLTWANGDNSLKSIVIDLLPDAVVDDFENFTLILSNPTNATVSNFPTTINIIDQTSIPSNDACANAFNAVTLPYSNVQTRGQASTNNNGFMTCESGMNDGLWYSFIGNGSAITVAITNVDTSFDPELFVYDGTCSGLLCIAGADSGNAGQNESSTFTSTLGITYYVNVGHFYEVEDFTEGNFKIDITTTALANNQFEFSNLKVYPNPVTSILNVENSEKITKVSIINLLGQELITKNFDDLKTEIDFSGLQSGNYFAKVYSNDSGQVLKIIKK